MNGESGSADRSRTSTRVCWSDIWLSGLGPPRLYRFPGIRAIVISIRTALDACSAAAPEFVVLTAGAYCARVTWDRAAPRRLPGQRHRVLARHRAAQPRPKKWVHRLEAPAAASMRNQNAHERMIPLAEFVTNAMRHAELETRPLPVR